MAYRLSRDARSEWLAALVAACLVSSCALSAPEAAVVDVADDDLIASPDGPVVLVAEGTSDNVEWRMHAFRQGRDVCISFPTPGGPGGGCRPPPPPDKTAFGVVAASTGGNPSMVYGTVGSGVTDVRLELRDGGLPEVVMSSLRRAGIDEYAFIAVFDAADLPARAVALDDDGAVVDEVKFPPP